jgi:outer membrane receptor for ferrienterochelin and colicins
MVGALAKYLLLALILLLLIASIASAQAPATGRLTGTVTDPQGAVVSRAAILVRNDRTGAEFRALANAVGVWVIPSVPSGTYTVTISAQGFKNAVVPETKVEAGATTTTNASLQIGLEKTVIVTASKYEEEIINAPASASVVSAQAIRDSPSQNVANLLRTVPGMNVAQSSAVSFGVASRNASGAIAGTQLALIDGRTLYQDDMGTTWWHMDESLDDIKQMEVIRGGSYAMNGVVNIITKAPREMMGTTFTLGIGTFDRSGGGAKSNTGSLYYARATHAQTLNDHWAFKITGGAYTQDAFARP